MTKSTKITIIAIVLIIILAIGFVIPTGNLFAAAADNKNIKYFSAENTTIIPTAYITTTEKRDGRTKQKIFWTTRTILPKNLLN